MDTNEVNKPASDTAPSGVAAAAPGSPTHHFAHHIYLDRWKMRHVHVTAPVVVTKAEMDRIQGWLSTIFIVDEENNQTVRPEGANQNHE